MNANKDASFILKQNKKSGNYAILRKGVNSVERIKYIIYGAYLPYGREEYNDSLILNAIIDNSTNINYNLLLTFQKIIKAFENLKNTDNGKYKYAIDDKLFFNFLKEIKDPNKNKNDENNENDENDENHANDENNISLKKYQLRLYLRYGAKVTHIKYIGELTYNQLKGKKCNLNLELGCMWVNNEKKQYGINIYVTHVTVLN